MCLQICFLLKYEVQCVVVCRRHCFNKSLSSCWTNSMLEPDVYMFLMFKVSNLVLVSLRLPFMSNQTSSFSFSKWTTSQPSNKNTLCRDGDPWRIGWTRSERASLTRAWGGLLECKRSVSCSAATWTCGRQRARRILCRSTRLAEGCSVCRLSVSSRSTTNIRTFSRWEEYFYETTNIFVKTSSSHRHSPTWSECPRRTWPWRASWTDCCSRAECSRLSAARRPSRSAFVFVVVC